jgi:hypothetical protein
MFMQLLDGRCTNASQSGCFSFIPLMPHSSPIVCGGWLSPSPRLDCLAFPAAQYWIIKL